MDRVRTGDGPPRPSGAAPAASSAKARSSARADPGLSSSSGAASAPQPTRLSSPSAARALALAFLSARGQAAGLKGWPLRLPASAAPALTPSLRQQRLESLASVVVDLGKSGDEALRLLARLEHRLAPLYSGDPPGRGGTSAGDGTPGGDPAASGAFPGGAPLGAEGSLGDRSGGSGRPGGSGAGRDADRELETASESFRSGLRSLPGFGAPDGDSADGAGAGESSPSPAPARWMVIPFDFAARTASGEGKIVVFKGNLRLQLRGEGRACGRLEADLTANGRPWRFSLRDGGGFALECEGGIPPGTEADLAALGRRLAAMGFRESEGTEESGSGGGGLWA